MDIFRIFFKAHEGIGYLVLFLTLVFGLLLLFGMFSSKGKIGGFFRKITLFLMLSLHVQVLVGIVMMFFFSPGFKAAKISMKDSYIRSTYIEHPASMLVAAVLVTMINRGMKTSKKLSLAMVFMGIVMVALVLYAFPWSKVFA